VHLSLSALCYQVEGRQSSFVGNLVEESENRVVQSVTHQDVCRRLHWRNKIHAVKACFRQRAIFFEKLFKISRQEVQFVNLRHHHHISVMELGQLLTRSDLTYPEVSSKIYHDSFCKLSSSVSLAGVIYFEAFYLYVVSSFSCIPVICTKLVLFLTPLRFSVGCLLCLLL